jgi:glycosyltransferase involved in cell wall biosynthesis
VVVAPSRGPELGRPVIEAAANGVPVVASGSRTGGGVVVPDETGVLVEDFTVEALADAVAELLRDPERRRRLGQAARAHAEENFDPGKNARRIEDIYRSVVPRREAGRIPILYVHHRPQLGGAPSSLAQLIRNLDPRFEPHVFCPEGPAAELFASSGATVHTGDISIFAHAWDSPYEGLRWLVLGREVAALPAHLRQLERLMREHRFPLVHLNDSPLLPAAAVAHRHRAKVVWHLRSALAGEGRDKRSRLIASLIDRWGDAAIAIDRDVAARFPIELPLTIVHNSVSEPSPAGRGKGALNLPEDKVAIGFAGFVRRQKGWPELVAAAEILVREGVPAHFVIMGGGVRPPEYFRTARGRALELANLLTDEESAIKELVAAKGLSEHFSFLPFTAETGEVYNVLDIVTFPNQGVGLGRPVLEAAMYGKPVVASGSRDGAGVLVPGETGLLLGDSGPEAIAVALRSLIEDDDLRARMGEAAADHARRNFDPVRNARAVERVYEELLDLEPTAAPEPLVAASGS